jgi:hypothetical protein
MFLLKLTEQEMDLVYDALREHRHGLYGNDEETDAVFDSVEDKFTEVVEV